MVEQAPQELVMTLLGSYLRPRRHRSVWAGGLVALLAELGFSAGAARVALTRMAQRDLLERHRDGRQVHYTPSGRTLAILADGDERIFSFGRRRSADEPWTLLWHSVPEDRKLARARLVRRLRFLGFGPVGDGTWLAPHDREREVAELLAELEVRPHAGLMVGRPPAPVDVRVFAARAWDLEALAERYAAFVAEFERYQNVRLDDATAFAVRTRLVHAFRRFPMLDPELPEALVPPPRRRADAVALFQDLYPALAEAAGRHFDEVVTP
ncbi:PaaX family transcriptional regulator [Amycolatopsis cihanbeyliensis]|nr:PaaX family transcriptional regulator C-terminal domain-containing protein [Amycolatopsis cihanbeyliensis]